MSEQIPADALYELSTPTALAVSPDGERVAVVVEEHDGREETSRSSVFVVPTDGSRPPHRLSRTSDASQPAWSPDGPRLAVLASRDRNIDRTVGLPEHTEHEASGETDELRQQSDGGTDRTTVIR